MYVEVPILLIGFLPLLLPKAKTFNDLDTLEVLPWVKKFLHGFFKCILWTLLIPLRIFNW